MLFESIDRMWHHIINKLLVAPSVYSRNGNSREILGWQGTITDIEYTVLGNPLRNLSLSYASAEVLWYLMETQSTFMIEQYAPSYRRFTENGIAWGAYGPRIIQPLRKVVEILHNEPNSRQAVCPIFATGDVSAAVKEHNRPADIPCTISLQFILRNDRLHCIATMRSNDVWLGFPYDVFAFTTLQRLIANQLCVGYGTYTHQVGSLHVYEKQYSKIEQVEPFDSIPHSYSDGHDGSTLINRLNALEAEFFYRNDTSKRNADHRQQVYGQMFSDLVHACRLKFHPKYNGHYQFISKAFQHGHNNNQCVQGDRPIDTA